MGLSCYCSCKQRLAGSGRAYQERSLGKACADIRVLLGIVKKIYNLF